MNRVASDEDIATATRTDGSFITSSPYRGSAKRASRGKAVAATVSVATSATATATSMAGETPPKDANGSMLSPRGTRRSRTTANISNNDDESQPAKRARTRKPRNLQFSALATNDSATATNVASSIAVCTLCDGQECDECTPPCKDEAAQPTSSLTATEGNGSLAAVSRSVSMTTTQAVTRALSRTSSAITLDESSDTNVRKSLRISGNNLRRSSAQHTQSLTSSGSSLVDLFSPPLKASTPKAALGDDDLHLSQSFGNHQASQSDISELATNETLSESEDEVIIVDRSSQSTHVVSENNDKETVVSVDNTIAIVDVDGDDDEEEEAEEEIEEEEEFDPYLFISQLPPLPPTSLPTVRLPPKRADDQRLTLVLDLDETLVHCSIESIDDADFVFPVVFNTVEYQVYVRLRPHFGQFLRSVAGRFEIVVFTASQEVYADTLLHLLDPKGELIEHRLFRDSCVNVGGNYVKDLSVLGRDLKRMVIVDNSPQTFGYQLDNGIPIESWFDDSADRELLLLLPLLNRMETVDDVRPLLRQEFNLAALVDERRRQFQAQCEQQDERPASALCENAGDNSADERVP